MTPVLITGFFLGMLGSLHCAGMCGPIALALPVHQHKGAVKAALILIYNGGRVMSYAALGALAGLAGEALILATSGRILSIVAGILLIVSAASLLPVNLNIRLFGIFRKLQQTLSVMLGSRRKQSLFVLGLLNGLLPCGLVYMALTTASVQGSITKGALLMAFFGTGTIPVMMLIPFAGNFVSHNFRTLMKKAVPVFIIITGILLIFRGLGLGIPVISPAFEDSYSCHGQTPHDQNCHQQGTETNFNFEPVTDPKKPAHFHH